MLIKMKTLLYAVPAVKRLNWETYAGFVDNTFWLCTRRRPHVGLMLDHRL